LYDSLCCQTCQDFEWLVVDDGSTDNTEQLIAKFIEEQKINIRYLRKDNGGKHTAINLGAREAKGDLFFIVDSDDHLTCNAVELISSEWESYKANAKIGCLSFIRARSSGEYISKGQNQKRVISNHVTYRINGKRGGDRSEVLRTNLLRQIPFPEIPSERFMSEGYLWNNLARHYDTVYIDAPIYICEYLDGGLTKTGRSLRMKCPIGMMENCKAFFLPQYSTRIKTKEMWLFIVYACCARYSLLKICKESGHPFMAALNMPFGLGLYLYWKKKYLTTI
jgi:glycosyltransferase involved in cell wall biosynthesis